MARRSLTEIEALIDQLPDAAVWKRLTDLDYWEDNPRDNDEAATEVADLIIEYGFGSAMMAWPDPAKENRLRIIAGNTRKKAMLIVQQRLRDAAVADLDRWHHGAILLARTGMVPVRIRDDLTEAQATELALADNKANELATWNRPLLTKLLKRVPPATAQLIGWRDNELARLLRTKLPVHDVDPKVERAAELQKKWKTKIGQLWRCGEHLLLCGDTTNPNDVTRVMGGLRATIGMQDPPYGVDLGAKNRLLNSVQKSGRCLEDIEDDALNPEELKKRLLPAFVNYIKLVAAPDCTHFVFSPQGGELGMMMLEMMREAGMPIRHILIWVKNQPTFSMGRLDYDYKHEPILMSWGKSHKRPMGGQFHSSIWEVDRPRASPDHPTPKPPELYVNAILNHTEEGDIGFDGYAGTGPMIIACEQTHRVARCIEKSPGYCAVILERWVEATQTQPELVT